MTTTEGIIFGLFALGGFLLSFLVNKVLLRFSTNLGIRSQEEFLVRWSKVSKPSLGGISFFITFLVALMTYAIAFGGEDVFQNKSLLSLLVGATLGFVMGLADDAYNTKPYFKLFIQILVGCTYVLSGDIIEISTIDWLNIVVTVFWVVGIMNSINMLDNMDGISTVTSISILSSCLLAFMIFGNNKMVFPGILLCTIFGLVAFLFYNWNPSKMFMGDSGSQFLGALLAFAGIKFLWGVPIASTQSFAWENVILVLTAFAPTLIDTFIVSINRILAGRSPMVGGRDHSTHALSYRGFSDKKVGLFFVLFGLVSCLLSFLILHFYQNKIIVAAIALFFIVSFITLLVITRKYNAEKNN